VWTFGRPDLQRFRVGDGAHFFQFLQFAGPFLTWFAGGASSVLDLSTGRAFDVDGTVSGSAEAIVVARTPTSPSGRGKASGPTRLSAVAPPSAPRLPACG